ncbi:hypothetical protein [Streptomyces sp. NPDC001985]|uniref:hypothetical protein n=1 Tax=Streptomyces sp. NPDC001985 TaxID=3154406 RepID=UPI00332A5702
MLEVGEPSRHARRHRTAEPFRTATHHRTEGQCRTEGYSPQEISGRPPGTGALSTADPGPPARTALG